MGNGAPCWTARSVWLGRRGWTPPGVIRVLHDALQAAPFDPANAAVRAQFAMPSEYEDTEDHRSSIARRAAY
ncbi:MAG: Tripartite-type tricarboxylate transporter, receptor component TctC [Belnapia sp.]|nr:Tripartite-type tricarboxylate transporter, receptor component TctC [Belnapia sp.]